MIAGIFAFLGAIFVIVLVHELGHLVAAKYAGMRASVFSVGFGKKLWGFHWRDTEYRLSLIPLGGYVRIDSMEETVTGRHGETTLFETYPMRHRALVISAGVVMNLILAFGLYLLIPTLWGLPAQEELRVARVDAEKLAPQASGWDQLPVEARVVALGDEPVGSVRELYMAVAGAAAGPSSVTLDDGRVLPVMIPEGDDPKLSVIQAIVPASAPVIGAVKAGGPAEAAGLQAWDRVLRIDGKQIHSWQVWTERVGSSPDQPMRVTVLRDGQELDVVLRPRGVKSGERLVGVAGVERGIPRERVGLAGATAFAGTSVRESLGLIRQSWEILFKRRLSVRQVSGPVSVAGTTARIFRNGWEPFLSFIAFLSVNIAIVNFLPIPALDGGFFALLGLEAVRRRPLTASVQNYLGRVGMIWLFLIMIGTLVNDVLRLAGQ